MQTASLFDLTETGAGGPGGRHDDGARLGPLLLRDAPVVVDDRAGPVAASSRPTLLAVDGDSLVHRAFHGYGEGALYGVLALLAGLADLCSWQAVVVGFDERSDPWRRSVFPGYKAHRPPKPEALTAVLADVPPLLADIGICVVQEAGHEADDVLGSAAAAASARSWCSVLATSDRDAFGLVDEDTTVLRLRSGLRNAVAVTPSSLRRSAGVDAGQYLQLAALRGDPSDNLPGLPGIGPSRAAELLAVYPTIEAAAADPLGCRSVLGPELGQALVDDLARADSIVRRNLELMAIRRDLPIDLDVCARRLPGEVIEQRLVAAGLGTVAGRMAAAFGARPDAAPLPPEPLG